MIFDINNKDNLHELFILLTTTTQSNIKYRGLLANFLEILCVLKGIKSGYICSMSEFNLSNLYEIRDFLINSQSFVYYPNNNLIVNKKIIKNIDFDPNLLSTSMFSPDSYKLGKLLGYPCPGFNFKSNTVKSVSFNLIASDTFRNLFNYRERFYIQIIGFRCDTELDEFSMYIHKEQLDYYFNNTLNFGQVTLTIKKS
jgi:hypothetical protein